MKKNNRLLIIFKKKKRRMFEKTFEWIELHPALISAFTGLVTFLAIAMTYYFSNESLRESKTQFSYVREQQTKTDLLNKKREKEESDKNRREDSLQNMSIQSNLRYLDLVKTQIKNQQNDIALSFKMLEPNIRLVRLAIDSTISPNLIIQFVNQGSHRCMIQSLLIALYNLDTEDFDYIKEELDYNADGLETFDEIIPLNKSPIVDKNEFFYFRINLIDGVTNKHFHEEKYFVCNGFKENSTNRFLSIGRYNKDKFKLLLKKRIGKKSITKPLPLFE